MSTKETRSAKKTLATEKRAGSAKSFWKAALLVSAPPLFVGPCGMSYLGG
jgi:hypothetical protein